MVEYGYEAGKKPATCRTCGKIFPRPNISGIKSRNASPTRSQKSSVASWSQALCEQSRSLVETVLPAAMGPCAPSEPVPFSSRFVVTSEHAVISGLSAGSFAPVQGKSRVDCAVTHRFGGVESVARATYISTPSKPVFSSSGIEVTSEHARISVFLLSHQRRPCCLSWIRWNHVWWVLWKSHVSCTPRKVSTRCGHAICTCWLSWSRIGVSRHVHQQKETQPGDGPAPFQSAQESSTGCETQICCTT